MRAWAAAIGPNLLGLEEKESGVSFLSHRSKTGDLYNLETMSVGRPPDSLPALTASVPIEGRSLPRLCWKGMPIVCRQFVFDVVARCRCLFAAAMMGAVDSQVFTRETRNYGSSG